MLLLLFRCCDHCGRGHVDVAQLRGNFIVRVEPKRGKVELQLQLVAVSGRLVARRANERVGIEMLAIRRILRRLGGIEGELVRTVEKAPIRAEQADIEKITLGLFTCQGKTEQRTRKDMRHGYGGALLHLFDTGVLPGDGFEREEASAAVVDARMELKESLARVGRGWETKGESEQ